MPDSLARFAALIITFAPLSVQRSLHAQVLLVGAILAWCRRTVASVQRITPQARAAKGNPNLASAAQARGGETRTIHRRPYRRQKSIPERPGMLTAYRDQLRTWMDQDPKLSAMTALERLTALAPDVFGTKHLRTLQRAVKTERTAFARRLISEGNERLLAMPPIPAPVSGQFPQGDTGLLGNILR